MRFGVIAAVFPAIFIGELPDKSMFVSLTMAARGRPVSVWIGAAGAFLVHVIIAVSVGAGLFEILPARVVDLVVAALFAFAAAVAFVAARSSSEEAVAVEALDPRRVAASAFFVIFLAEWGDLTQVLTANLALRYHSPVSVGIGATLGLWVVSGLAVVGGHGLLARLPTWPLRLVTGSVLAVLSLLQLVAAFR